jgi:predicted nucleotidyltransferase
VDFFMNPNLADCYLKLKSELDRLIQKKVSRFFSFAIDTRYVWMMLAIVLFY